MSNACDYRDRLLVCLYIHVQMFLSLIFMADFRSVFVSSWSLLISSLYVEQIESGFDQCLKYISCLFFRMANHNIKWDAR